jgi:predicted nucleic acid-binding protein
LALIVDTGVLFASLDRGAKEHARCRSLLDGTDEVLVLPAPILSELDYLIASRLGGRQFLSVLGDIRAGAYRVEDPTAADYGRVIDLLDRYADLDLGFVDASVFAVVERLNEPKLATLDHRHFSVLRPRHVDALELVPA